MKPMRAKKNTEPMKPKVCAYCRVSTAEEEQLESFDHQVSIYADKILSNPDWEFAGIYADSGISGTTQERPEFQRMITDAEKHRIDIVLCKSISRFARNLLLTVQTVQHFKDLGVRVIFEKENIDTMDPKSDLLFNLMAAFAQEESRNISERVKAGIHMGYKQGKVSWTPVYGYEKVDDSPYQVKEDDAVVVRRIFDEYEKGKSVTDIAKLLNAEGVLSPKGNKWIGGTIKGILKNPVYVGDILTNKTYIESHLTHKCRTNYGEVEQICIADHHEAIIDRKQFDGVQTMFKMRAENEYPYQNYLVCPCCGRKLKKMTGEFGIRGSMWGCAKDVFLIPGMKLDDAVLRAYAALDLDGVTDEVTRKVKAENQEMMKPEYWWIDSMVESIIFGNHNTRDDQTLTVNWICGKKTTVETKIGPMSRRRRLYREHSERRRPVRGEKKVTTIPSVTGVTTLRTPKVQHITVDV